MDFSMNPSPISLDPMIYGLDLVDRLGGPCWTRRMVDPGTVFLFKAASTMIVAAVQCTFAGKDRGAGFSSWPRLMTAG